jgi:hypothetical protein
VSLKSSLWRYLGLLAVAALAVGVLAGPASAKKLSAKQRAAVRTQLRKEIKKNPKAISRKSFVKRASLVDFTLPVTIKLRGATAAGNPNQANIDLGASLGKRTLNLGGSLAAQIQFHDSYDGGALGNVDLKILPSASKTLTSTSLPLLWNKQVSDPSTNWNSSLIGAANEGCGDFSNGAVAASSNGGVANSLGFPNSAAPGVPIYPDFPTALAHGAPTGFLPEFPGVDGLDKLAASGVPGNDNVGANPTPFPSGTVQNAAPGSGDYNPGYKDAVLRTGALRLSVANSGIVTDSGVDNTQNITIGQSGGQANLFGNIPGKAYGIDVTVSLATKINSILRSVAPDPYPLVTGSNYPGAAFTCRQAWSGTVQNYIPGVKLKGSLHISPAITAGGLRIAKASLSSLGDPAHIGLAACLSPEAPYAADSSNPAATVPAGTGAVDTDPSHRPIDESTARTAPGDKCDTVQSQQVTAAGYSGIANPSDPAYTTTSDGSKVSVAGDISVQDIEADIMVGDVN